MRVGAERHTSLLSHKTQAALVRLSASVEAALACLMEYEAQQGSGGAGCSSRAHPHAADPGGSAKGDAEGDAGGPR